MQHKQNNADDKGLCTLPLLASLFWLLYKSELTKVFNGYRRAEICNECQYVAHMHFLGQAFPTENNQILSVFFFSIKKKSVL